MNLTSVSHRLSSAGRWGLAFIYPCGFRGGDGLLRSILLFLPFNVKVVDGSRCSYLAGVVGLFQTQLAFPLQLRLRLHCNRSECLATVRDPRRSGRRPSCLAVLLQRLSA